MQGYICFGHWAREAPSGRSGSSIVVEMHEDKRDKVVTYTEEVGTMID
jgi:hypothetical protein